MADWRPSATREALQLRADAYALIRAHFAATGALEVETPILSAHGTTDLHIESFVTRFKGHVDAGSPVRFMRTSPEFAMKRLLAAGYGDCYELGRVFRNGEAGGRHNPEFTMLEWYRVGMHFDALIDETTSLLGQLISLQRSASVRRDFTYRQLFETYAGFDPHSESDAQLESRAAALNVNTEGLSRDDCLDLLFTHSLQPHFPGDAMTVVRDFPATQCALAKVEPDASGVRVARRFEVFLGPLEVANGYDELDDADEQARRQMADLALRDRAHRPGPARDTHLIDALQHGMPAACGVAVGVDRVLMALCGTHAIEDVIAFNFQRA